MMNLSKEEYADYHAFLRCKGLSDEDDSPLLRKSWQTSKKKGKFESIYDRKRRQEFSPGRFHANTQSGYYLNKNHVKGSAAWRIAHGE